MLTRGTHGAKLLMTGSIQGWSVPDKELWLCPLRAEDRTVWGSLAQEPQTQGWGQGRQCLLQTVQGRDLAQAPSDATTCT